jgi:RNA polymerase sigma factor (sigma-70 family)
MMKSRGESCPVEPTGAPRAGMPDIAKLLRRLRSANAQAAWEDFLLEFSSVLFQMANAFVRDEDEAADCFVYICEQFTRDRFRRLLQFKPEGPASFTTWLRVVARNLSFDWRRKKYGRIRPFKSVQSLSPLELEAHRLLHERGLSREETLQQLLVVWPHVTMDKLGEIESKIADSLSSRQRWILSTRKQRESAAITTDYEEGTTEEAIPAIDAGPTPETLAVDHQQRARLSRCLGLLPPIEQLIVRLRFEDELSLKEIGRLTGLGDPLRVHRRLASILETLRIAMAEKNGRKTGNHVREIRQETR